MSRFANTPVLSEGAYALWERPTFKRFLPEMWIVREGDMLDLIAYEVYGKHEWWWAIAVANNILNPLRELKVGMKLKLPDPSEIERFEEGW